MVGWQEFYTAAPAVREQRCRYRQARHAQQQFARAFRQRQCQGRVGWQAGERREQQVSALLYAERSRNGKGRAANRLSQALQQQGVDPTHRVMDQQQNQIYLAGADQPADEGEQKTRRHRSPAAIGDLDGTVDCRRVAHPLRPVALAGKSLRGAHQLAEQTTPLHPIESPHLHRQQAAGDQRRDPQRLLGQMGRLRPEQRDTEQRKGNLREGLQRGAHRDRGGGLRQRQAALRQVPGHQQWAAHLSGRHEAVGRLARPPGRTAPRASKRRPRRPARTAPESPRHRAPAAADETAATSSRPHPASARVATTAGSPCETSTPMNSSTPADKAKVAARVMLAGEIPGGSRSTRLRPSCWKSRAAKGAWSGRSRIRMSARHAFRRQRAA